MSINPRNAEYTKEYNRHMFLRLLRSGPKSRVDITRHLGLTRSATTLIADELLSEGLIAETAPIEDTLRGRPPMPLTICGDACYAIGVYLSRHGFRAGIVDFSDNLITNIVMSFDSNSGRDKTALLISTIKQLIDDCEIPLDKICGIGISCPGPINELEGEILNAPHFKLWANTKLAGRIREEIDLPVYLEKDAACLARYSLGREAAGGSQDYLLLLMEGGVGSGLVTNGRLLKTYGRYTCEIGHTTINIDGPVCECGNFGCLERYAAIRNLLEGSSYKTIQELTERRGEPQATALIEKEADYLAAGVVNAANIVSINTVLLSGDITCIADTLAPMIEKRVNRRLIQRDQISIKVRSARITPESKIIAASDIAFDRFLSI